MTDRLKIVGIRARSVHPVYTDTCVETTTRILKQCFNYTLQPTSPLHSLLPPPRDQLPTTRLRAASKFPRIPTRTKKSISHFSRMP